jgi:hypothetical protein
MKKWKGGTAIASELRCAGFCSTISGGQTIHGLCLFEHDKFGRPLCVCEVSGNLCLMQFDPDPIVGDVEVTPID